MPEYLAPGVYVEEVSFRARSIEGVSTTTTGFVGPTRYGPTNVEPDVITSIGEFERVYGDGRPLEFDDRLVPHNMIWHACNAFFTEGGKRLYVARVFRPIEVDPGQAASILGRSHPGTNAAGDPILVDEGVAEWRPQAASGIDRTRVLAIHARHPGRAGNMRVRVTLRLGQNVLGGVAGDATIRSVHENDVVWVGEEILPGSPPALPVLSPLSPPQASAGTWHAGQFYQVRQEFNPVAGRKTWRFAPTGGGTEVELNAPGGITIGPGIEEVRVVTATVTVFPEDPESLTQVWDGLALDPQHDGGGGRDGLTVKFARDLISRSLQRTLPIVVEPGANLDLDPAAGPAGLKVLEALRVASGGTLDLTQWLATDGPDATFDFELRGGNDGNRPGAAEYVGAESVADSSKTGLVALEDIEDISIVAAPGSTYGFAGNQLDAMATVGALIAHAERMRYRIAVLDSGDGQSIADVRAMRAKLDSKYAALYYPWVRVLDSITREEISLPPSGFVAGIYARNDIERAVYKAPANEVVRLALGFEILLNKSQQDVLNPEGINCFRFFEDRGFRLWGARTISSDPEWKYVNLRRYFAYLERSIDRGTQWAVFEPNGERLWANVRRTVEDFLFNEFQSGALLGTKPEQAYFVKCDRSTMTQNDLDNGRLVCLVGVAPLRPAEFVIFRIGQFTADAKV